MIAIASDHGGFEYKKLIIQHLEDRGIACKDFGTDSQESCDYPDFAIPVAKAVAAGEYECGILICGTGIGVSIAANKVRGVYAAEINNIYQAERAQLSNKANVITLGAQVVGIELAKCLVKE